MPNRSVLQSVAVAGAFAISASLIGFAALAPSTSGPTAQMRQVALTSGEIDHYAPVITTFDPTTTSGLPPFLEVQQGAELWNLITSAPFEGATLTGVDTHTTIGPFVNDYFVENSEQALGVTAPSAGSEIDLANFGGGFENEFDYFLNGSGGYTLSDTLITPDGDVTIPLGSTAGSSALSEVAAAVPAAGESFSALLSSIDFNTSAGEQAFNLAATAFADGEYALALSETLNGFNNLTVGVGSDLLVNGYAALTGADGIGGVILENPDQPENLAIAFSEAQDFLAQAQGLASEALSDFGSGSTVSGLLDLTSINIDTTSATDAIILGLFDALTGAAITT